MEANVEKISPFHNDAVQQIKSAILESQLETARAANKQMLSLYYAVGKFVSENSREGTWGKGAIDTISAQLRREIVSRRLTNWEMPKKAKNRQKYRFLRFSI